MEKSGTKLCDNSRCDVVDEEMLQTQSETPSNSIPTNNTFIIDDRYIILKLLGEGAFGA